ncbi:TRAP transporter substrate-binding protein DctP [Bacillus sp. B15-48]|uniref:TRAP transporter substrate-binding protein n=1 Tax=Bacillus sp. B15-48 TaxID=1548601 RepID=UPI00193FFAE4|nr:TRAP transporter substrate-binding protein DctP [Bacillus sp. B15-48]
MKKVIKPFHILVLLSILIIAACGSEGAATPDGNQGSQANTSDKKITLRASAGVGPNHYFHRGFYGPLMERVEEETNGTVSFEVFTSGELVALGSEYDALRNNTIDIALTLIAQYDAQRFPYTEVTMLPVLEADASIAAKAFQNMMKSDREILDGKTYYDLEFGDKDLVAFAVSPTEPYVISTTKKKFESVDDFSKNIRLRTTSRATEMLTANLGVTSVSMPISEAYDALSRNAVDGLIYNMPDWTVMGFDELIKYTIEGTNFGFGIAHFTMTKENWEKLPGNVREKIQTAADELIIEGSKLAISETEQNRESNIAKNSGEFIHLDDLNPETSEYINQAMTKTWNDWIETQESGGFAGKEIAKLWRDMLVDAGGVVPQAVMEIE